MYRVDPGLTGPLMEMVSNDAGGCMTGSKMAKAAVREHQRLSGAIHCEIIAG